MDLSTTYMGLSLRNPIVVAACPLSEKVENIVAMEKAGAGAVVMFSLFEEQLLRENASHADIYRQGIHSSPEALSHFPDQTDFHVSLEEYLEILHKASNSVGIPIIASLNGISESGWIEYAVQMEKAGAKGIELNIYYIPATVNISGSEVEKRYLDVLRAVKSCVSVPVSLKLSPYFSSMAHLAHQLSDAGADGLVLFNRFYEPDFNIETLKLMHILHLSTPSEIRLPLLWTAILYGRIRSSIGAGTGVHGSTEVIKYILAGADVVMMASALLKHGIPYLTHILDDLRQWMQKKEFSKIKDWRGLMSQRNMDDPTLYERANYIKTLKGYEPIALFDN
ncbi:MAG: dihydroorotate dehydrogenase-like protein [Saprospiraceae bacterium]|nr:dihydroorotate dehydrogenase-like protein [Saprospiraceae bacterium]